MRVSDAASAVGSVSPIREHQLTIPNHPTGWSDSHICWLAALAVTIFVITGSLVPFDLTWPGGLTLAAWPMQLRFTPWRIVSGTDIIVNVAVGAPLGFFLAGAVRSDGRCSGTVAMLAATGMAAVLATTVELFQVLSAFRQSSWNDVLAQTAGAAVGAVGWMSIGRQVVLWLHHLAGEREPSGFAARILQIYLPIYLLVQFTTVDAIRASELPTDHSRAQVILLPIRLGFESTLLLGWECLGSALLSLPIGMLAVLGWVRRGERRPLRTPSRLDA